MAEVCTRGVDTGFVALGYFKVAVLGVVQGITELLPISSTAHMRVVPALLGWQDPGSAFSAAMQLAALAAVVSYFWQDVKELTLGSISAVVHRKFDNPHFRLVLWIGLGTIPIGVAGLALAGLLNTCNTPLRRSRRGRRGMHRHGDSPGARRALCPAPKNPRRGDAGRRDPGRHRPGRRADSRRLALRLDVDGGAGARLSPAGGGPILVPSRPARHRARRPEGIVGAPQGSSRRAWLVGARLWSRRRGRSRRFSRYGD